MVEINELRAPSVQLIMAMTKTAIAGASHCQAGTWAEPEASSTSSAEG